MVMLKVLQQYYSATGDERVIELMSAYFRYQLRELPKTPLGHWTFWGEQRGGDNLASSTGFTTSRATNSCWSWAT